MRWVEERQEEFTSTIHGRGEVQYVEAAYRNDGKLLALRTQYYTDLGAYSFGGTHGVAETLTPSGAAGAYTVENLEWTVYGVYTNKMTVGPYRGYGQHATAYAAEVVMDGIARALGLDPAEVRRRNLIPTDAFPYRTPTGRLHDSGDYHRGLEMALDLANYAGLREEQARLRERGELLGIGIATTVDASGFAGHPAPSVCGQGMKHPRCRWTPPGASPSTPAHRPTDRRTRQPSRKSPPMSWLSPWKTLASYTETPP